MALAENPYAKLTPGERLQRFPSQPWNDMLDLLKQSGVGGLGALLESPVKFRVKNDTGGALKRYAVLQTATPIPTYTQDAAAALDALTMKGTAPASDKAYVITQSAASAGEIVPAACLGDTWARLNVTAESDTYARPTTSTSELTTGGTGSARILWKESGTGTGKLGRVRLLGVTNLSGARVTHDVDQTLNAASYPVQFNSEGSGGSDIPFDSGAYHDNSTNNTRLTIPVDGIYLVGGAVHNNGNDGGGNNDPAGTHWRLHIQKNGTASIGDGSDFYTTAANQDSYLFVCTMAELVAGDYLELVILKVGGFNTKVLSSIGSPSFWINKLA